MRRCKTFWACLRRFAPSGSSLSVTALKDRGSFRADPKRRSSIVIGTEVDSATPTPKLRRLPGPSASATAKSDNLRRGGVLCGVTVIVHVANMNCHAQIVARDQLLGDLERG